MIVLLITLVVLSIAIIALLWYLLDEIITISVETRILWERQTNFLAYYCSEKYVNGDKQAMKSIFPYMKEESNENLGETGTE